jgi:signal transduction histidine kinase
MKFYELSEGQIQIDAEFELGKRAGLGSLSHVLLFTIIFFSTPLLQNNFWLTAIIGYGLLMTSIFRLWLSRRQKKFYQDKRMTWLLLFDVSMVIAACLWGVLCEEILRQFGFINPMTSIILLIICGITAGAANSFNPSFKRAMTFIALVLGIPFLFLLSSILAKTPLSAAFAAIFAIYFSFLLMQVRSQFNIFWSLLRSQKQTKDLNLLLDKKVKERTEQLFAAEAKLIESAKMTALGEMAAGIAHEINNPLGIISLVADQAAEFINDEKMSSQSFVKMMHTIDSAAGRISDIIKNLRTFSRDASHDQVITITIGQIIKNTLTLCQERIHHAKIKVHLKNGYDLKIQCRGTEISQALLNLITNACDAIAELTDKWIAIEVSKSEAGLEISVTDSGGGIPEEIQTKLFQPFFTTKEIGKGAGLGLSVAKGIIETHQGSLRLDNSSRNTRFVIQLPVLAATRIDKIAA